MDIMDCITERRSVRSFTDRPVSHEVLEKIARAGLYAASGRATQATKIVVITDRTFRDRLMRMNAAIMGREGTDPFYGAPVVFVVLADRNVSTAVYDGSLVMGNMMLAAHALGLGSCWIHRAKEEFESAQGKKILSELAIPDSYEGIGHLIVGYADGVVSAPKPRLENRILFVPDGTQD